MALDIANGDLMMNIAVFIGVLLSSALGYYTFIYRQYLKLPSCRLEHRIPYWVLTGKKINLEIMQLFIKQYKKHQDDGMFVTWAFPTTPWVIVYGEDAVRKIVSEPAAINKPPTYKVFELFCGKGILSSNGEMFKKQRNMLVPAFHVSALKSYTTIMNKYSEELVKNLKGTKSKPTDDIIQILGESAIRILFETNLGEEEINHKDSKFLIDVLHLVTGFIVTRMFNPLVYFDFGVPFNPTGRKACEMAVIFRDHIIKPKLENIKANILSRRESWDKNEADLKFYGKKPKPFGETFVEQHLQDPNISLEDIAYQITFIVCAGYDTVVHSMKFCLFLLGMHPDIQEKVRQEVMSETEGNVTYEDLHNLQYLECVIKESLRLYPVPLFARHLQKDLQCGKHTIPKNATVIVCSYMLHRNPEIYPNPEKFDPDRFLNKDSPIKPWQFIPFAEGLRHCTGKHYAMIQMKILLAHILRNFKVISLDRWEDIEVEWCIILHCTKKLRMQFIPV